MFALCTSRNLSILCAGIPLILLLQPVLASEPGLVPDYQPGQGWQVPGTGLKLGGYTTASYENVRGSPTHVGIEDISLFMHWEGTGKLRLFTEFSIEDPIVYTPRTASRTGHPYFALERLYGDYLYSEKLNVRAGKFLTPIGRWNVVHAGPLVWTTSRPLITERTFPSNATGLMAYGTLPIFGKPIDYSVYSAFGADWRPDPKLDPFTDAYGMHATVPLSGSSELGVSLASFEQRSAAGEGRKLVGVDYFWSKNRFEVSAEAAYRFSGEGHPFDEKGLFVQGVAPLSGHIYAVGRYEYFHPAGPSPGVNLWLLGIAAKPRPAFVIKMEFREGSSRQTVAPDGVSASLSFLF